MIGTQKKEFIRVMISIGVDIIVSQLIRNHVSTFVSFFPNQVFSSLYPLVLVICTFLVFGNGEVIKSFIFNFVL